MGDFVQLAGNGRVDLRVAMPMEIGPDRGIGVEIFAAPGVTQHRPATAQDDDGFVLQPVEHLGERVPDKGLISFCERLHSEVDSGRGLKASRARIKSATSAREWAADR